MAQAEQIVPLRPEFVGQVRQFPVEASQVRQEVHAAHDPYPFKLKVLVAHCEQTKLLTSNPGLQVRHIPLFALHVKHEVSQATHAAVPSEKNPVEQAVQVVVEVSNPGLQVEQSPLVASQVKQDESQRAQTLVPPVAKLPVPHSEQTPLRNPKPASHAEQTPVSAAQAVHPVGQV